MKIRLIIIIPLFAIFSCSSGTENLCKDGVVYKIDDEEFGRSLEFELNKRHIQFDKKIAQHSNSSFHGICVFEGDSTEVGEIVSTLRSSNDYPGIKQTYIFELDGWGDIADILVERLEEENIPHTIARADDSIRITIENKWKSDYLRIRNQVFSEAGINVPK